ncbi:alpha/beta hydrolase fold domain-containing protein [Pantoea sp. EA-12]|uniref:alpha/beta hydrolase n=1 Tax=Pantoea sp. EA-12 TaxID=3043303 RepID=UPI0024B543BF|nr:alpha/beta hydrolase fold domain-containing protein [Pantoea sp. EA-12]MDI9221370.1 alpha/beta hydrolase fold domain-containing protein [Pantoea sp. EA-12]
MSYVLDPQLAEQLAILQPALAALPAVIPGDAFSLRSRLAGFYEIVNQGLAIPQGLTFTDVEIPYDGLQLSARRYSPERSLSKGIVLYVHGGAGVGGTGELYDKIVSNYASESGIDFISLEYGLSPETNGLTQTKQVIAAWNWLKDSSTDLDIDPKKIVLMGDSGGGGIVASTAIYARDHQISLAGLVLIYPMIDHKTAAVSPALTPFLSVSVDDVTTGWAARLGNEVENDLLPYISASTVSDMTGLPPTYLDVGELDLFCNENIEWASRSVSAAVQTEFHLYPGVNHGFDLLAPASEVSQTAMSLRCNAIRRMLA